MEEEEMRYKWFSLMTVILVLVLAIAACGPTATEAPPAVEPTEPPAVEEPTEQPAEAPTEEPAEEPAGEAVEVRWFIGLGAGGNPEEIEKEEAFVEEFNAKYGDQYKLVMDLSLIHI